MKIRNILFFLSLFYFLEITQAQEFSLEGISKEKQKVAYFSFKTTGKSVLFNQIMVDNSNTLTWSMGDGKFETKSSFDHIYKKEGKYTVILIVKNQVGVEIGKFGHEISITN